MADSAVIRPLDAGRKDQVAEAVSIVNLCYRGDKNWTNEKHIIRGARITVDELLEELEEMTMFVAVLAAAADGSEKIIGCISSGLISKSVMGPIREATGYAGTFAVHPDYGGKGLGNKLMQTAENFCRGKGALQMILDVLDCREDIIAWYSRKGYVLQRGRKRSACEALRNGRSEVLMDCSFMRMEKKFQDNSR